MRKILILCSCFLIGLVAFSGCGSNSSSMRVNGADFYDNDINYSDNDKANYLDMNNYDNYKNHHENDENHNDNYIYHDKKYHENYSTHRSESHHYNVHHYSDNKHHNL